VICASSLDPVSLKLINLFPLPNEGVSGQTYSNYLFQGKASDNTSQYDTRADWTVSKNDFAFGRFSDSNEPIQFAAPLGILDGGAFSQTGGVPLQGRNFALSETHLFGPAVTNEARFGYNWLHAALHANETEQSGLAQQVGLGGLPSNASLGALPNFSVSGISGFGTAKYYPADERENVIQFLDNVSFNLGRHTVKTGLNLQQIRVDTFQPQQATGAYAFTGKFTGNPALASTTGFGVADFLLDEIDNSTLNNLYTDHDSRWYRAAYLQDDWKVTPTLTLSMGLRYEYAQPMVERNGAQANFVPNYSNNTGVYLIPEKSQNVPLPASLSAALAASNITVQYTSNNYLVKPQYLNFAPRFGFAKALNTKTVVRGAFGIFYGGLESVGYSPNLGQNAPFGIISTFTSGSCSVKSCATNGQTLETGFTSALAQGLNNFAATPTLHSYQYQTKTPYTEQWNLTVQRALPFSSVLTMAYVGSTSRHLPLDPDPNQIPIALVPGVNAQAARPFLGFGGSGRFVLYAGDANYNALQITGERRFSNGIYLLTTYTWAHALDDAYPPLGGSGDSFSSMRNWRQLGVSFDYGSSYQDVRNRFTLNLQADLPLGSGRRYLNGKGWLDAIVGHWSTGVVFQAQSGNPTELNAGTSFTDGVGTSYPYEIANPFATGLSVSNNGLTCAAATHTIQTWFNPCAFSNPAAATGPNDIAAYGPKGRVMVYGPGFNRVNFSAVKRFPVPGERSLELRTEVFNLLNTPAFGQPNNTVGSGFGQITTERFGGQGLAAENPDGRLIQLALRLRF
jgi:hypothetical protein